MARQCRNRLSPAPQANLTKKPLTATTTEIHFDGGSESWWVDTGVSRHVCYNRDIFTIYTAADDQKMLLGDSHTTKTVEIGNVKIKLTIRKTVFLKVVMHLTYLKH